MYLSLEYIAGFFDGEGSVAVYPHYMKRRKYKSYVMSVRIGQIDPVVLHSLKAQFGGILLLSETPKKKPFWQWGLKGKGAAAFLRAIRPFCINKADQIDIALEFMANRPPRGRRRNGSDYIERGAEYEQKLKEMKREVSTFLIH